MRKNLSDASFDFTSPFRQPARRKSGPVTNSNPMNSVIRSREEAMTTEPRIEATNRK